MCVCMCVYKLFCWFNERKKVNTSKGIGPKGDLFLSYFSSTHVSSAFHFLQEVIMVDGGAAFDLYCGNCFDKVVHFNSRFCVWEFSVRVNCLRQIFVCASIISLLYSSSFSFYKSIFCVFVCLCRRLCPSMRIYFRVFYFSLNTFLPPK